MTSSSLSVGRFTLLHPKYDRLARQYCLLSSGSEVPTEGLRDNMLEEVGWVSLAARLLFGDHAFGLAASMLRRGDVGTTMMKRHDLSIFVAISLILHALFFSFLLQWARSTVQAKPQYDNISVSLVPGSPQVNTAAKQASSPRPLRGPQPVVLPKPMPEKPIVQEKKPAAPQQEPIPTSPSTVQDSTDGGVRGGMGTSGTTIGQGSPGGVPAVNAAAGDTVNAERAFANARDAYVMELYAIINKHFVYPTLARKRGQEGKVQLRFVIGDDGRAENIEMVSSSGYYLLDRAAMETIRLIPLPRPPRHAMQVPVTIVYRLEDAP